MSEQRYRVVPYDRSYPMLDFKFALIDNTTNRAVALYFEDPTSHAAAMNAAEKRDAERKLLEKMADAFKRLNTDGILAEEITGLLAEYDALQTEE